MAYLLTSATGVDDLLDQLGVFAAANSWTVSWNAGGQLGLFKGNCFVALGKRITTPAITRRMLLSGGTSVDTPIIGTLCSAFGSSNILGGHTGAPGGSSATSENHVWTNDWTGPFSEVHFISGPDNDYIHVMARTIWTTPRIDDRWSVLSFGFLDNVGMSGPRIPYLTGTWFEFWENATPASNGSYSPNRPSAGGNFGSAQSTSDGANTGHSFAFGVAAVGTNFTDRASHLRMVTGFLNTSLFPNPPIVARGQLANRRIRPSLTSIRSSESFGLVGDIVDFAAPQITSIGNSMIPALVFYGSSHLTPICFLGQYPGMRWIDMTNLNAKSEFEVNLDTWIVFPFKRKNSEFDVGLTSATNTWKHGFAFLKE